MRTLGRSLIGNAFWHDIVWRRGREKRRRGRKEEREKKEEGGKEGGEGEKKGGGKGVVRRSVVAFGTVTWYRY